MIVGPENEINHILGYPGTPGGKPPCIYSDSWENALEICRKMTNADIDERRERVVRWYQIQVKYLKAKVFDLFEINDQSVFLPPHTRKPSPMPTPEP